MLLLRSFLALSLQCWTTYGAYVQTKSCNGDGDSATSGRSLDVHFEAGRGEGNDVLQLNVGYSVLQQPCNHSTSDFSATLDVDLLGRHSVFHGSNSSFCLTWPWRDGKHSTSSMVYPLEFELASLPPLSTFNIRLQLESGTERGLQCLEADLTPALTTTTSASLVWTPRAIFIFVLLVGVLRYHDERASKRSLSTSDLRLPGVADCLGYMQWVFLSGGLSLHYPGFFQPIASKLSLFSLFVAGPLTHGRVYPSVSHGIYSINGTYGGTVGLEHMQQIVGAPSTVDTWVNMVIAIAIISVAAAVLLEVVGFGKNAFGTRAAPVVHEPLSTRLSSRLTALLRVVLSYFTLPLSALSFYQLSASAKLPVWHTVSAAMLIISIILAFIWLFRQLPSRTVGLLMHETPKWYREQNRQVGRAERIYVGMIVSLTLIRGAIIGGLQAYGPVQLSLLAMSEVCLLFTIGWLRIHPWLSMSTVFPVMRLITTLLMVCFVRGLVQSSTRSAIGYAVVALHASVLAFGILLPAVYHAVESVCTAARYTKRDTTQSNRPHELTDIEAHSSRNLLVSPQGPHARPPTGSTDNHSPSQNSHPPPPEYPATRYFREPRHSSLRAASMLSKLPVVSDKPCHDSTGPTSSDLSNRSSEIARSTLVTPSSSPSSARSDSMEDDWHDTRSVPLGPRWHDYTYREGDAFYAARTRPIGTPDVAVGSPSSAQAVSRNAWNGSLRSVNSAVSALSRNVLSAFYTRPVQSMNIGFEVVRPPRASPTHDHEEELAGNPS